MKNTNETRWEKQSLSKTKRPVLCVLAAIVVLVAALSFSGCGKKAEADEIQWSEVVLRDQLPEPPSTNGTIYENSDEKLWLSLEDVTDAQYNEYLDACITQGFTGDAEKSSGAYKAYNEDGYALDMNHIGESLSITLDAPMELGTISWPESAVGKQVPAPKSTAGKFDHERDDSLFAYIGDTSKEDYAQYVADCSAKGFTVNYDKAETAYQADNNEGYHLALQYVGNHIMTIAIDAPKNEEAATSTPPTESAAPETPANSNNSTDGGLRSDFKAAMDSYETFMDEYVAFMKKYESNPTDVGVLADYASYMSKYADMVGKFDQWESEDLNEADLAYYLEVQTRVNQKLLAVTN